MMRRKEWSHFWHHHRLDINLFRAWHAVHAYPRHSHDYYVVALVEQGVQSFLLNGSKHFTPAGGVILLNPADVHTGEPVDERGFEYRAFYPTEEHMASAARELCDVCRSPPSFRVPRSDDVRIAAIVRTLHDALTHSSCALELESLFLWSLVQIIKHCSDQPIAEKRAGKESDAVKKARDYIHEHYMSAVSLSELAQHVNLSRYYLLRTFRDEVGMPPHAYLENLRVQAAQILLAGGRPLAEIAHDVGFSSQSHFTQRFKQIIGITPGKYVQQIHTERRA